MPQKYVYNARLFYDHDIMYIYKLENDFKWYIHVINKYIKTNVTNIVILNWSPRKEHEKDKSV